MSPSTAFASTIPMGRGPAHRQAAMSVSPFRNGYSSIRRLRLRDPAFIQQDSTHTKTTVTMTESIEKISPVPTETTATQTRDTLELSLDNVEKVLDEMRPYLISDGGNVTVVDIDGATVRLRLEGACGSCPSSTMTMKMGLERRLLERIPEIEQVVEVEPEGPPLTDVGIEKTLDEVRPFLQVAGGTIELVSLKVDSAAPTARLKMTGSGAAINSVKVEITHRLKRNWVKLANVIFE